MKFTFDKNNLEKVNQLFSSNQSFNFTALPRLKMFYALKKELKEISGLEWFFDFDHVNLANNRIIIEHSQNKSKDFNFYYEIPLTSKFELRVFLANSSVHFLDIYNFLLKEDIIHEKQFSLKAEYHTIPHFILNDNLKKYNAGVLKHYLNNEDFDGEQIDGSIKKEIERGIQIFNPIFNQILNQFNI